MVDFKTKGLRSNSNDLEEFERISNFHQISQIHHKTNCCNTKGHYGTKFYSLSWNCLSFIDLGWHGVQKCQIMDACETFKSLGEVSELLIVPLRLGEPSYHKEQSIINPRYWSRDSSSAMGYLIHPVPEEFA